MDYGFRENIGVSTCVEIINHWSTSWDENPINLGQMGHNPIG